MSESTRWWTKLRFSLNPAEPLRTVATIAVAISAAYISYDTLYHLALAMGLTDSAAHLFPIGIDAAVLAFTCAWLNRRFEQGTRDYAKRSAIFFIATSIVGNGIEHARTTLMAWDGRGPSFQPGVGDWAWLGVIILFSALMPLALGLILHLIAQVADDARYRREQEQERAERRRPKTPPVAAERSAPSDEKTTAAAPSASEKSTNVRDMPAPGTPTKKELGIRYVVAQVSGGRSLDAITAADIDRATGSNGYFKKHMDEVRAEVRRRRNDTSVHSVVGE